jgi:hypothetical protein
MGTCLGLENHQWGVIYNESESNIIFTLHIEKISPFEETLKGELGIVLGNKATIPNLCSSFIS